MSDTVIVERASFWRESLKALVPTLKTEWRWVAAFAVIMSAAQFFFYMNFFSIFDAFASINNQTTPAQRTEIMNKAFAQNGWGGGGGLVSMALVAFAVYFFTILYLRSVVKKDPPEFALGNFFYWFGQCIKKYALLYLPLALFGLLMGAMAVLKFTGFTAIAGLVTFLYLFYFLYILFRLFLVTPIAVFRRSPVIKNSWNLTKGQFWRIFCGVFVQGIVLLPVYVAPFIFGLAAKEFFGSESPVVRFTFALTQGIGSSVCIMASVILSCTIYRILLQERRQNPAPVPAAGAA
ncbi:MAG: hypothetical protein WCD70_07780 [Alphaproteobacteria bacterium]